MAPLPPGQPGLREPGDGAGPRPPRRGPAPLIRVLRPSGHSLLAAAALGIAAIAIARTAGVVGRGAIPDLVRAGAAGVLLFGVCGFGLVRLLLPVSLRRHEPLWVLPVGACSSAVALALLGYAQLPFNVSLALVLAAGVAAGVYAVRRTGLPGAATWARAGWPAYVALLLAAVALVPLFRAGFATVGGEGQDAHLAVGTAEFLQDHPPTAVAIEEAVDRVPLVWRSKPPIYYALAAQARLSGLDVFEVISVQAALLLALAVLGFFLVARDVLRAPFWVAVAGAGIVGLDRMVLHTVMHPYFNQTWGLMTLPFALVLAWWAARQASLPARGGLVLLAGFLLVGAFAYPLMLPIPLLAVAVWLWPRRRLLDPRKLWRGPRTLLWAVPLAALLLIPIGGVLEKAASAYNVVFDPTRSLRTWGGDLLTYYEEAWFFGLREGELLLALSPFLLYGGWVALGRVPPLLARGFLAVFAFAAIFTVWFRLREYGYYFHFKTLAFIAPLALLVAVVGLGTAPRRWLGLLGIFLLGYGAIPSATRELGRTFDQLPKRVLELRSLPAFVPPGDSIRLDIDPQEQNWVAFMLHERPLCSRKPLLNTSYPHVRSSRKSDFIVTKRAAGRPDDATGGIVAVTEDFVLYRADPSIPGRENCSQRMVQTVTTVDI